MVTPPPKVPNGSLEEFVPALFYLYPGARIRVEDQLKLAVLASNNRVELCVAIEILVEPRNQNASRPSKLNRKTLLRRRVAVYCDVSQGIARFPVRLVPLLTCHVGGFHRITGNSAKLCHWGLVINSAHLRFRHMAPW